MRHWSVNSFIKLCLWLLLPVCVRYIVVGLVCVTVLRIVYCTFFLYCCGSKDYKSGHAVFINNHVDCVSLVGLHFVVGKTSDKITYM